MSRHLYSFGPFQLDTAEQVLRRDGQPLPLKPKIFDLLVVLVENSGRVVCKDELMKLTGKEKSLLAKRYTENAEAYEAYLKGCYFLEKRTTEGCKKGIEYFEQAIAIDPNYALAYAGVAGCYVSLSTIFPSQECNPRAERAALSALELDGGLAEAHTSLGIVRTRRWDWSAGETEFKTAIELSPN